MNAFTQYEPQLKWRGHDNQAIRGLKRAKRDNNKQAQSWSIKTTEKARMSQKAKI